MQGISATWVTWTDYKSLVCLFRDFMRTDGIYGVDGVYDADMKGKAML